MCCLALTAGFLGPRLALFLWWIFDDRVDLAFDSWIWPLLGLIFLPWTTLAYLVVWSPVGGVSGAEWIVVALDDRRPLGSGAWATRTSARADEMGASASGAG